MHVKTKLTDSQVHHINKNDRGADRKNDCSCLIRTGAVQISPLLRSWRNGAQTRLPLSSANSLYHNEPTANFSSRVERAGSHFLSESRSEINCQGDGGHTYLRHIAYNICPEEQLKPSDIHA